MIMTSSDYSCYCNRCLKRLRPFPVVVYCVKMRFSLRISGGGGYAIIADAEPGLSAVRLVSESLLLVVRFLGAGIDEV